MLINTRWKNIYRNTTAPRNRVSCYVNQNVILCNRYRTELFSRFINNLGQPFIRKSIIINILATYKRNPIIDIYHGATFRRGTTAYL